MDINNTRRGVFKYQNEAYNNATNLEKPWESSIISTKQKLK